MDVLVAAESPTDRSRLCQLVAAVPGVDGLRQAASRADTVRAIETAVREWNRGIEGRV